MKVYIFHDYVHHNGPLYTALIARFGADQVRYVTATEIKAGILDNSPILFVRGGGASRYAREKLHGEGYQQICTYIENGGHYLGICGGAYDACTQTRWADGTPYEIIVTNPISVVKASAIGPISDFATALDRNSTKPRFVKITIGEEIHSILYWGGSRFEIDPSIPHTVEAYFSDLPGKSAAIVSGNLGKGAWLLSSPHIEFNTEALSLMTFDVTDNTYEDLRLLGPPLTPLSHNIFNLMLDRLFCRTMPIFYP